MVKKKEKDKEPSETTDVHSDKPEPTDTDLANTLTKEELRKFYEEKGIDLSLDIPIHPKPIPQFEKSVSDKIASKFGSKVNVDYVRPNRIRISTKREDILDVAYFILNKFEYNKANSFPGLDYQDSKK